MKWRGSLLTRLPIKQGMEKEYTRCLRIGGLMLRLRIFRKPSLSKIVKRRSLRKLVECMTSSVEYKKAIKPK